MKKAFTLAEVLITLIIVGAIASMTIPSIVNQTNNAGLRGKWRKVYSDITQATALIRMDNGGTMKNAYGSNDAAGWQEIVDLYSAKMNVIKTCDDADINGNCWYTDIEAMKLYNNTAGIGWHSIISHGFVLANGASVAIHKNTSQSNYNCVGVSAMSPKNQICIYLLT